MIKQEIINLIIENKMPIVMFIQFLVHKGLSYYVKSGKKSVKGFIKFLIGKNEA